MQPTRESQTSAMAISDRAQKARDAGTFAGECRSFLQQATRRNVGFLHHSSVWNGMVLYKRADMDLSWCLWSCLLRCALLVAWRKGVASAQRSSFSSGEGKVGASKGGGGGSCFLRRGGWDVRALLRVRCGVEIGGPCRGRDVRITRENLLSIVMQRRSCEPSRGLLRNSAVASLPVVQVLPRSRSSAFPFPPHCSYPETQNRDSSEALFPRNAFLSQHFRIIPSARERMQPLCEWIRAGGIKFFSKG